jgi:hypothetical protein
MRGRGRNGWFAIDRFDVQNFPGTAGEPPQTYIDVYSKTTGDCAPIVIRGRTLEIVDLLQQMLDQARRNL